MTNHYSRESSTPNAAAKARADGVRVHYKNTYETASAIRGMTLKRVKKYLNNVLRHTEAIPFRRFTGGPGRNAQAKHLGVSQARWPTNSVYAILKLLRNAEANAVAKGLNKSLLYIEHISVTQAPKIRRRYFRAHGRINPYVCNPTNIEVILAEKKPSTDKSKNKGHSRGIRKRTRANRVRRILV